MINIESLKKYVGIIPEEEFMELATKIYMITDFSSDTIYYSRHFAAAVPAAAHLFPLRTYTDIT